MTNKNNRRADDTFKAKFLYILIAAGSTATVGLSLLLLFWFFKPYHPFVIESDIKMLTPNVRVGDNIAFEYTYSKTTNIAPTVTRRLLCDVDGTTSPLRVSISDNNRGSADKAEHVRIRVLSVKVPSLTPPKRCKLNTVIIYQMNPVREITITYETPYFNVLPDNDPLVKNFPPRNSADPAPTTNDIIVPITPSNPITPVAGTPVIPQSNTNSNPIILPDLTKTPLDLPIKTCLVNLLGIKICN